MADALERAVYETLERLGIPYETYTHPPVFTVEDALSHWAEIDAAHCKNLFLRDRKGTRHYLVIAEHTRDVNLQVLARTLGVDRLSFASPERLARHLGLAPGSVSPFGLLNDATHHIPAVVDAALRQCPRVAFHPNVNTATVVLAEAGFERFLQAMGNPVRFVAL